MQNLDSFDIEAEREHCLQLAANLLGKSALGLLTDPQFLDAAKRLAVVIQTERHTARVQVLACVTRKSEASAVAIIKAVFRI